MKADTKIVLIFSTVVSLLAVYFSYTSGLLVAYNDAAAHLNTARRMIDSLTPGIVQIGSVWLPLLHIFELPFVVNTYMWSSGLAGAAVSSLSFIFTCYFLYKLLVLVTNKTLPGIVGILILATNPNLLYLQTTAMFEPLLMATAVAAVYFLTRWAYSLSYHELIFGAFFIMLSTLTRYDGWALFVCATGVVLLISTLKTEKGKEGPFLTFLFLAGFGIFLWLLYNQLIFSDALYFMRSEYSARAQQIVLEERGELPTKHNLFFSIYTYVLAVLVNNGIVTVVIAAIGIVLFVFNIVRKKSIEKIVPLLLLVPFIFNILSLYLGQSVIWMPFLPPYFDTYFNVRYGVLLLPGLAFFIGYLSRFSLIFTGAIVLLTTFQIYLFLYSPVYPVIDRKIGIITLQDMVSSINTDTLHAGRFMKERHTSGLVLVSTASADAFVFRTGIPLKNFITEGTGQYWDESLDNPKKHAKWIVFFNDYSDRVGRVIKKNPEFLSDYTMIYQNDTYQIWER